MKRILLEVLLGLLVVAGAGGSWWFGNQHGITRAALVSATSELEAGRAQIEMLSTRAAPLQQKASELDAVRAALASGVALEDLEAAAKGRPASAERMLSIGAVRMLTKGAGDAEVKQSFEKALELIEWNTRLRSLCAAQAGLIAAGQKIEMLADCKTLAAAEAAAAAAAKAAAAAPPPAPAAPAGRQAAAKSAEAPARAGK